MKYIILAALLLFPVAALADTVLPPNTPYTNPSLPQLDLTNSAPLTTTGTVTVRSTGASTVALIATGSGSGLTFAAQGLDAAGNWDTLNAYVPTTCASVTSMSANGVWLIPAAGFSQIRVNLTVIGGGTETFSLEASAASFNCIAGGGTPGAPSTVTPVGGVTTTANSTIAVTNTFQTAIAASATRLSCTLQNQGTHTMYVFFGALGGASLGASFQLAPGQPISCDSGVMVATDAVEVTGTAGDAYVVTKQ